MAGICDPVVGVIQPPGGGPSVDSFNGRTGAVVPEAGDYTAAQITSTGPSNLQADFDALAAAVALLQASVATSVKKVESWADFIGLAGTTESPAGVWTYTEKIQAEGDIVATVGHRAVQGAGGEITSYGALGGHWVFDVDAPAFTGPMVMKGQSVTQASAGASSRCLEVTQAAPLPRPLIQSCEFIGGNTSIEAHGIISAMIVTNINMAFSARGLFVRGSVGGVAVRLVGANNGIGAFIAVELDSTLVAAAAGGVVFSDSSFVLAPGQFGYVISHAATISSPALIQISGANNTGPQDAMIRQTSPGVTDMAIDDDRLVIKGGPSVANWLAASVASRFDLGDPIIVDTSTAGAGVSTIIPYEDGAGNTEIVASIESHFTFFKGASPLDWYFEYTGPLTGATARLTSDIQADRASAGPSGSILCWERAPKLVGPGHGAFAQVLDSEIPWVNENRYKARTGTAISQGTNTFDRFRPVISDDSATDVRLGEIKLDLAIGS